MREALPELGGELEAWVVLDLSNPVLHELRLERLIERSVDLDGVEELCEVTRLVKAMGSVSRIHDAVPVRIRPAGRADARPRSQSAVHIRLLFAFSLPLRALGVKRPMLFKNLLLLLREAIGGHGDVPAERLYGLACTPAGPLIRTARPGVVDTARLPPN